MSAKLALFCTGFLVSIGLSTAFAEAPEVYSSVDATASPDLVEVPRPGAIGSEEGKAVTAEELRPKAQAAGRAAPAPAEKPANPTFAEKAVAEPKGNFEPVASDQMDSVANRLKYVEILIRKYGRAYDYRVHTNKDLRQILQQLDGKGKPGSADPADSGLPAPEHQPPQFEG